MNSAIISNLKRLADVNPTEAVEHVRVDVCRDEVTLSITIPISVLEWWVEATEIATGRSVQDWCDYEGYEESSIKSLAADMSADVEAFITHVLSRRIRFVENEDVVEWEVGGVWQQAIPFAPEPNNPFQPIARKARSG